MSRKSQYIAIRSVLDYEMRENEKNTLLPIAVKVLLDDNSKTEEQRNVEKAAKFSTILKGKYSIEWWGIKMAYLYGTLKANDIISSSELELFNQKIDEQMINNS